MPSRGLAKLGNGIFFYYLDEDFHPILICACTFRAHIFRELPCVEVIALGIS